MAPKSKVELFAAIRRDSRAEGLPVRALDRPDRHPPGRRGRGRADPRRPGHRRAARHPGRVRGHPRSRRPGDASAGRRHVLRHAPAVAGLRALAAGRCRAAQVRHRRARSLPGDRDRRLLPVRQPRRPAGRRTGRRRAAQPGRPIAAPDFGSALIAVSVWQAVLFIALRQFRNRSVAPGRLHAAVRTGQAVAGATARPSGSSAPLSSNSTTPLHSRLHPARDVLPRSWQRCGPAPEQSGTAADAGIPLFGPGSLDGPRGRQLAGQLPDVVGGY